MGPEVKAGVAGSPACCSDPYGCGCRNTDVSLSLLVERLYWSGGAYYGEVLSEPVYIDLCAVCQWWECDHDWDKRPAGPVLPEHVKRYERIGAADEE